MNLAVEIMQFGLGMAVHGVFGYLSHQVLDMGMADIVGGRICPEVFSYNGFARTPSVRPST